MKAHFGDDVFESWCDYVDVTCSRRPDTSWRFTDANGHEHHWYANGKPASVYNPEASHTTPTLRWVQDDTGYFEDGEPYDIGHHECRECGEHIERGFCGDQDRMYVRGLRHCTINGESVTPEEFDRRGQQALAEYQRRISQ